MGGQGYTELGHRLIEIAGSQPELSKALGVTQSTVGKKLRGDLHVTVADLQKIARYLDVPMSVFFELRGTDGAVLRALHEMHMYGPDSLDKIISAFRHNRRLLRTLATAATNLVAHTDEEPRRRRERIFSAGAQQGVALPAPADAKEGTDESQDDNQAHPGVGPDE